MEPHDTSTAHDYFPPFGGLKAFYEVGLTGSAVEAAARLKVTPSAISHQLRALETELGVRLIENRKGKLFLTADGKQFFSQIRDPMATIVRATDLVRSSPARKRVTVTLTPSFAAEWFLHRIADLEQTHSDIEVNMVTTTRVVDLNREGVDLAIRRGAGQWSGTIADPLMAETIVPVISPSLLSSLKATSLEELLSTARILGNSNVEGEWDRWCRSCGFTSPDLTQRYNLPTYELSIQAAKDGLGVTLARRPLADPDLETGRLVQPFSDVTTARVETGYYVVRSNEPMSSVVKRFHNWLLTQAE
ncbi:LysR family transcriptional regulator [Epibacterium ulvae]|uniref:LysR substrate-binding domain-containing protein n=1 Tax=Epibacterium ulvae TaxID=1156985 RepID=UPI001BFCCDED|nr:LysR substrate-binding domain-containing protein [Epibacterium ulvae]MBT8155118.1 LysR family transcriptional regulator [Epibacterium ulvae]